MIDLEKLKSILEGYKAHFINHSKDHELFKWMSIKSFRRLWNIDAEDFGAMFDQATAPAKYLLDSGFAYPRRWVSTFASYEPETMRQMFRDLFDESRDIGDRVKEFWNTCDLLLKKYNDGSWRLHYQSTNAVSVYLWLMYPDKYYIYKYEVFKAVAKELSSDYRPSRSSSVSNLTGGYRMYDEICKAVSENAETVSLVRRYLTDTCYSDPGNITLTMDIGFYIGMYLVPAREKQRNNDDWHPTDYNPGITVEQWKELLADKEVFTPDALLIMKRMKDYGGEATCKQLSEKYGQTANFYNIGSSSLARRIVKKTGCPTYMKGDESSRYWPVLYMGRDATAEEKGYFVWRLRSELSEALDGMDITTGEEPKTENDTHQYWWLNASPKIWTFESVDIGEEVSYTLYNESGKKRRIFQNFIDVKVDDIVVCYEATPVKKIVALAKVSQASDGKEIRIAKTENLITPIEYQTVKDRAELMKMEFFTQPNGSLFKITEDEYDILMDMIREENPIRSEGELIPPYTKADFLREVYLSSEQYDMLTGLIEHKMNVILQGAPGVGKTFSAKRLAYSMMGEKDDSRVELIQFHQNYSYEDFIMGYRPDGETFKLTEGVFCRFCRTAAAHPDKKYFFIIDEINRGNLSKILGELMMLIEKDYRGTRMKPAYSAVPFHVPENLYIIGMMNTADRSLAMIDYALRRRFSFFEMAPAFRSEGFEAYQKSLGNETFDALIDEVRKLNQAIAGDSSLGAGFRIGHSYFCGLTKETCTDDCLRSIVEFDILPMLEEYWFDDNDKLKHWEKELRGVFDDE